MNSTFEQCIEFIYSPWQERRASASGLPDRERRFPERLAEICRTLGCLPRPSTTVAITGSKGKGSTARLIAWSLQARGYRVGLILSPHEREHRDRLRVSNSPISSRQLVELMRRLRPHLDDLLRRYPEPYYPAPSGIFMVLGLMWFHEQDIDYCVVEAGRGGISDESAHIGAETVIVTSAFDEHLPELGPSMPELIREKLGIGFAARCTIISDQVAQASDSLGVPLPENRIVASGAPAADWVSNTKALASVALERLTSSKELANRWALTGERVDTGRGSIALLPWIHPDSVDPERLSDSHVMVVGVSKDKLRSGLIDRLKGTGRMLYWLGLHKAGRAECPTGLVDLGYVDLMGDSSDLRAQLSPLMSEFGGVDLIGNQQLMALARRAFRIPRRGPVS